MRGPWVLKPTTGPGAARWLAAEAVKEGHETIVAAGGDGTLNEVLNGLVDAPNGFERARLGVLPLGTVNVFARELRLPLRMDKAWPILTAGKETRIDIGRAEFQREGKPETRHFIQMAGAGFDARTIELVNWEMKKRFGPLAYVVAAGRALNGPNAPVTASNGMQTHTGDLVLVGNGKLYGGSFPVLHKSELQDGRLDVATFSEITWRRLPTHLWAIASRKMFRDGGSAYFQADEISLTSPGRAGLELDGDWVGELPARISVRPGVLRVVCP